MENPSGTEISIPRGKWFVKNQVYHHLTLLKLAMIIFNGQAAES